MHRRSLLALALASCAPNFATVEEACLDEVPGARHIEGDGADLIFRVNCHRRLAGVRRLRVDPDVQAAAQMQAADGLPRPITEVMAFLRDRNYALSQSMTFALWSMFAFADSGSPPADRADALMSIPYFRQVLLQPSSRHVGAAQGGDILSMVLTYEFPTLERTLRPIVYPADGQIDAPSSWTSDLDGLDGIPSGEIGYPITVTVAGDTDQPFSARDPHALVLSDVELLGPDGAVEVLVVLPRDTQVLLVSTAIIVPLTPLTPDTEYTFSADVRWEAGDRVVVSTFTTAP